MKRQLMELGGKGAALVFDDANLKAAAGGIGSVFTFYSGQICTARRGCSPSGASTTS